MRSLRWTVVLALLVALTGPGWADEPLSNAERGGLLLRSEDAEKLIPAPILGTTVEVRVTGIVARTRVTQIFANPAKVWVEGIYLFPLPEGGAVDSLKLRIGERLIEGAIREKGEARQTYEAAKQEGARASLVEQLRPNVFTTSVANVGPGETVEVEIELQQVVTYDHGVFALRFPMVVAGRYTPPDYPPSREEPALPAPPEAQQGTGNPFTFHIDLAPGFPVAKVASPTHDVEAVRGRGQRWAVDPAKGFGSADSDFVLEWTPDVGREPRGVFFVEEAAGERYALLMVMPPEAPPADRPRVPREAVFLIDVSGSMQGEPMEQARRALLIGLDGLAPGDRFNVIRFDDDAKALFPESVPAHPAVVAQARAWVRGLSIDGGTNILAPLEVAFAGPEIPGLVGQVVLATDGRVANEEEILRFAAEHLGSRRLFTVGIGTAPNGYFLRKLAEVGRGTWTQIDRIDEVEKEMGDLLTRLATPVLTDLQLRWADPQAESFPAKVPDLYLGQPLVAAVRLSAGEGVEVTGSSAGEPWHDAFGAAAVVQGAGLDKLWARRKIEALSDSLRAGADADAVRDDIVQLGLTHHLVTAHTSLVAVDVTRARPPEEELLSRQVPLSAPRSSAAWDTGASVVSECILVASESPLLDTQAVSIACTATAEELARAPASRDPWAVLRSTPGVLTDRVNTGGTEAGQTPVVIGPGVAGTSWEIDGIVITTMAALADPGYYRFDTFEEMEVATGGGDVVSATPGVEVKLSTRRGTNEWRSRAEVVQERSEPSGPLSPRVEALRSFGLDLGGPLSQDRVWVWGSLGGGEVDRSAPGGQRQRVEPRQESLRLIGQASTDNLLEAYASRSELLTAGDGASPSRAPETTLSRRSRLELWKIEDSHILSSNAYLSAAVSRADRGQVERPQGAGGAYFDATGVARGTWLGSSEDTRSDRARLASSWFSNSEVSHEVSSGASRERQALAATLSPPAGLTFAGSTLGLPEGVSAVEVWRGGRVEAASTTWSLWTQDKVIWDAATLAAGLRWDLERPGSSRRAETLAPRLAFTYLWDSDFLLRATAARFVSRLGFAPAVQTHPEIPAAAVFLADGTGREPWYGVNLDLSEPGLNPNAVNPRLRPERTDELTLSLEHTFADQLFVGLIGTWRRIDRLLEERRLVRDLSSGAVFTASSEDWVPWAMVSGLLPDGTPYSIPVYDLRPGLAPTGGTLLLNGDRSQTYRGVSLRWHKRMSWDWMTRGHVSWHDWRWRIGDGFVRFDDPTDTFGSGDDGGRVVGATASPLHPHETALLPTGRWSASWVGLVNLGDYSLSAVLNGRDGFALPYVRRVARPVAGTADVQLTATADAFTTGTSGPWTRGSPGASTSATSS